MFKFYVYVPQQIDKGVLEDRFEILVHGSGTRDYRAIENLTVGYTSAGIIYYAFKENERITLSNFTSKRSVISPKEVPEIFKNYLFLIGAITTAQFNELSSYFP